MIMWIKNLLFMRRIRRASGPTAGGNNIHAPTKLDAIERWSAWATLVILLGIVGEIFALFWFSHPGMSLSEIWMLAACDVAIGVGLAIEYICILLAITEGGREKRESAEKVAEANARAEEAAKQAGEANERAANAERETEKLRATTAWRRLSQPEHETLALTLRASGPGASIRFCVLANDQESLNFAQRISIPFKAAGWMVGYRFESYLHGIMTGILLPEPRDNWLEEMRVVNGRVRDAFISAEIPFVNGWPPDPYMYTEDNAPLAAPIAWIYVGPKPMPIP